MLQQSGYRINPNPPQRIKMIIMRKEVSEVLAKEQSNDCCINLYLEECGWCAYEVSAYLLMNLLGGKCIVEKSGQELFHPMEKEYMTGYSISISIG